MRRLRLLAAAALLLAGCRATPPDRLRLDLERRDPEPLLRTYFGGYLGPEGGDPFAAGLLVKDGEALYVVPSVLQAAVGTAAAALDADGSGTVDGDELTAFVQATYHAARAYPATFEALGVDSAGAYALEVHGVMTAARRRVFVPQGALDSAIARHRATGALVYPTGTTIWGRHAAPDGETTVMRKRADGHWDFFVYDAAGRLAPRTTGAPRPLNAPTQCVGCHFGTRLFEPEKSFPADAPSGPDGPRALYTPHRDIALTRQLDEHARRSDRVLGLYATTYLAR